MKLTLNGMPSKLSGRYLKFPSIINYDENIGCEFSWEAITNMISKNGAFKS